MLLPHRESATHSRYQWRILQTRAGIPALIERFLVVSYSSYLTSLYSPILSNQNAYYLELPQYSLLYTILCLPSNKIQSQNMVVFVPLENLHRSEGRVKNFYPSIQSMKVLFTDVRLEFLSENVRPAIFLFPFCAIPASVFLHIITIWCQAVCNLPP